MVVGQSNGNGRSKQRPYGSYRTGKKSVRWKGLLIGLSLAAALCLAGCLWLKSSSSGPGKPPEAERVLSAQAGLPFQVLIPAYLPGSFRREETRIDVGHTGPYGEQMISLIYATRRGGTLTLTEWIPGGQISNEAADTRQCRCICRSLTEPDLTGAEISVEGLRVSARLSVAGLISPEQMRFVFGTLGPATNLGVYTAMKQVPVTYSMPPAVRVPANADGVQELMLVVTPRGYSPVHFAVKKGVPVRVIYRQYGQVGDGNDLTFRWDGNRQARLVLASANDEKILEFTPTRSGDFSFHCPGEMFQGVMTVED